MALSEKALQNKKQYSIEYAKNKYKRIPLDVSIEKYEEIKEAASSVGESINGYIKNSIDARLNSQNKD